MPQVLFVLREYCPGDRHLRPKGQTAIAVGGEPPCDQCGGESIAYMREKNFSNPEELLKYAQAIPPWTPRTSRPPPP